MSLLKMNMNLKAASHVLPLLVLVVAGCKKQGAAPAMMERPPAAVSVAPAVAQDVPAYVQEIGRTAATESVTIQPQVTGKIIKIHFTDGATIKKDDLLFTIDPRPFQATLDQASATLAQRQANVKWSQSEFSRMQGLKGTGAVSTTDVESKQNMLAVAEAEVKAAEAAMERAKLDLEYCTIKSPINGRAGQRLVDPGNVVSDGGPDAGTKLLSIQRLEPIYADFTVTEQDLQEVRKAMAKQPLKAQVWVPSAPDQVREGELTFLDNAVQEGSGTIKLRATLANADRHLWPGQFVQIRLVLSTLNDAVLIPTIASQVGQAGPFVYVVKDDSTAELRPIRLGQRQGNQVVVAEGLKAGERVITQGQMMVMPGGKVMVLPPPAGAPPTAPAPGTAQDPNAKPQAEVAQGANGT